MTRDKALKLLNDAIEHLRPLAIGDTQKGVIPNGEALAISTIADALCQVVGWYSHVKHTPGGMLPVSLGGLMFAWNVAGGPTSKVVAYFAAVAPERYWPQWVLELREAMELHARTEGATYSIKAQWPTPT